MSTSNEALNSHPSRVRATCVIPARLASARLARKPLALLGGAPLIVRVCENVQRSEVFERVVVACDSREVYSVVEQAGFEAVMTAVDLVSGTDRVAACAKTLSLPDDALIINVQGDEPFVTRDTLAAVVTTLAEVGDRTVVTARERINSLAELTDPNLVKIAMGDADRALYFSRAPIPYVRDQGLSGVHLSDHHFRHVGIYAYRHQTLSAIAALPPHALERLEQLEQLRWLGYGYELRASLVNPGVRGIDTEADLRIANQHYISLYRE